MRLLLGRHGQSQWQVEPGPDDDTPLSPLGHRQSALLASWLDARSEVAPGERCDVAALASSTMVRSVQTAGYLADALDLPVRSSPDLCEAPFHVAGELPSRSDPDAPFPPFTPSPRYAEYKSRAERALGNLARASAEAGGPVLVIAHGGMIKTMLRVIGGGDWFCSRLYNTGLVDLRWMRGRWHLAHLNLVEHLPPALRSM